MFWNRKRETPWRPEDDVYISNVRIVDGNLHADAVYNGRAYPFYGVALSPSFGAEGAVSVAIDYIKRCVVSAARYEEWQSDVESVAKRWNR